MNLVVGATGQMSSKVCHLLANKGKPVRTLVRSTSDPARVDELKACGAEIAYGNLCDYDSLKTACKRVQAVISTGSSMPVAYNPEENNIQKVDLEGLTHLIAAAKAEGRGRGKGWGIMVMRSGVVRWEMVSHSEKSM